MGKLIICEVVFTELAAMFPSERELELFLTDTGIGLVYANEKALYLAGSRWAEYARKRDKKSISCRKCGGLFAGPGELSESMKPWR